MSRLYASMTESGAWRLGCLALMMPDRAGTFPPVESPNRRTCPTRLQRACLHQALRLGNRIACLYAHSLPFI